MPKRKRYSQPKEESKQEMGPLSALFSAVKMTDHEVYGVSAMQQTIASLSDFDISVKDIVVTDPILVNNTTMNSLLEGPIAELIDAYATARGYTTGVTYAKVSEYILRSSRVLSYLLHMYRAQNVRNVVTPGGQPIGEILSLRPSVRFSSSAVADFIINATSESGYTNHVDDGAVSISNSTWATSWLSQLVHIKLSAPMVKLLVSLFGVYYQETSANGSCIFSFIPESLTNSANIAVETRFVNESAAMATMRAADRDLVDILNFLGFTNEEVISLDFNRDLRKQTLPLVQDPGFVSAYVNTNFEGLEQNDNDVESLFYDVSGKFTPLTAPDDVQLSADIVFASRMLRGDIVTHNITKSLRDDGLVRILGVYPWPLYIDITDYPSATQAQHQKAALVKLRHMGAGIPQLPYATVNARVTDLSGNPSITIDVGSFVNENANVYVLPDTFDFYTLAKKAEMIMGNTNYREQIQLLSNKIRTSSITKAT